ncbi:hypothetical protein PTKIN_Ptkin15bG0067300 [Pterospermum kingtungense]
MVVKPSKADKKHEAMQAPRRVNQFLDTATDNVGSNEQQNIRKDSKGNVGLIFMKGDLKEVSEEVAKYKVVGAPAYVGLVAPIDVVLPPGNTGLDPSHTSFFQELHIPTMINKGIVEIMTPIEIIKKGNKVGSYRAALFPKLGISLLQVLLFCLDMFPRVDLI